MTNEEQRPPVTPEAALEKPAEEANSPESSEGAAADVVAHETVTITETQSAPATPVVEEASVSEPEATTTQELVPAVAEPVIPENTESSTADAPAVAEASAHATTSDEQKADGPKADRIRQKLGSGQAQAIGTQDKTFQQRQTPPTDKPVEIPGVDDLDASLEAEIASAMSQQSAPPAVTSMDGETLAADPGAVAARAAEQEVGPGSRVTGTVQHIHGDDVFLNAGLRSDVVVQLKQFPADKPPEVGATLEVVIESGDEDGMFRARLPQARTKAGGNWDGLAVGQIVDCQITATNKGGLEVLISNLKGFLPASQVELGFVSDLEQYVGQKMAVQITEVKPKKRNLVVSRRALLQAERDQQQEGFWESLEVGSDFSGTVKTLKNYGAFINIGPVDGFLHVGEISWSRINHPNEVLKEGQEVQVRVLKIDKEKNRISLGMKQLVQNPWQGLNEKYPSERIVSGRVSRISDFGAFVELEPGVEGLVHISELAWRRVGSVSEVVSVGDEKEFKVLEVDSKRKRVSLSLKALEQKPESRKDEPEAEQRPPRRQNQDLRGGMGGQVGGAGLFGNPSDFS
ncbi:MAG: S1 RNA-binding domain-containing protein [Planctomycetaceae bacterium]|nr:S1 RNA-binding domain-containing protein [Planctomycetaceae bacterium]